MLDLQYFGNNGLIKRKRHHRIDRIWVAFFLKILDYFQTSFPAGCFIPLEGIIEAAFGAFFVLQLLFFQIKNENRFMEQFFISLRENSCFPGKTVRC